MTTRISASWTQDIRDPESKQKFEESLRLTMEGPVWKKLKEIIDRELLVLDRMQPSFDDPSWAYRQAFLLGEKAAYKTILTLMTTRETNDN